MIFKTVALIAALAANVSARLAEPEEQLYVQTFEGGERKLFPLLPGTRCPPKQRCIIGTNHGLSSSLSNSLKAKLNVAMDWEAFDKNLDKVVASDDFCTRRASMARAAGMAAGLSVLAVSQPAYAAETKTVLMGADNGGLQFVPSTLKICKGDTVKWINNKGGPHNVVFDEDEIPEGVSQEAISMEDQLGEEGESFSQTFGVGGSYSYYCEPHRGAGMNGVLTVV